MKALEELIGSYERKIDKLQKSSDIDYERGNVPLSDAKQMTVEHLKTAVSDIKRAMAADTSASTCNLQSVINWVACSERLPEETTREILVIINGEICCRQFSKEHGFYNYVLKMDINNDVTHWAAYPKPPCL